MTTTLTHLAGGLVNGATYALLALGLVLAFRVSGVVNFAHGVTATLAVFIAQALYGLGAPLALLSGIGIAFATGMSTEWVVTKVGQRGGHEAQLLTTVALFMIGDGLLATAFGADTRAFAHILSGLDRNIMGETLPLSAGDLVTLGITLGTFVALALLARTPLGRATRALLDDERGALRLGLPVRFLSSATWGLAGALGATAGLLLVPRLFLDPGVLFHPLLQAFAAAVLAGFSSVSASLLAGLLLGLVESLAAVSGVPMLQSTLPFLIILGTLLWRPTGIAGVRLRRRL